MMLRRRYASPLLLLRSLAFVVLSLTLLLSSRSEQAARSATLSGPASLVARFAAESQAATLSTSVRSVRHAALTLLKRAGATPFASASMKLAGIVPHAWSRRVSAFPRDVSVLRSIPRFGSEEPPSALHAV